MKKIFALLTNVLCFLFYVSAVSAQYGQYGQPAPSYSILVDKMVGKPSQNKGATDYEYVDNLSPSDPRFQPNQEVFFRIKVKNTSNTILRGVEVKDIVPLYLEPIEGPGTYNSSTRTITWNAGDFAVDEEKVFYIKMKVLPQANLPADRGLFCVINRVQATSTNVYDDDTSQLCIEKQVIGVAKVPEAGPEMGLILITGQMALLGLGMGLRKIANIKK